MRNAGLGERPGGGHPALSRHRLCRPKTVLKVVERFLKTSIKSMIQRCCLWESRVQLWADRGHRQRGARYSRTCPLSRDPSPKSQCGRATPLRLPGTVLPALSSSGGPGAPGAPGLVAASSSPSSGSRGSSPCLSTPCLLCPTQEPFGLQPCLILTPFLCTDPASRVCRCGVRTWGVTVHPPYTDHVSGIGRPGPRATRPVSRGQNGLPRSSWVSMSHIWGGIQTPVQ